MSQDWTSAGSFLLPRVKVVLAVPVIGLLVIGLLCFRSIQGFRRDAAAVAHTHQVLAHLAAAGAAVKDLDGGTRNFVLTGDSACLKPYFTAQAALQQELQIAARITADNLRQQARLDDLRPLVEQLLAVTAGTVAERKTGDRESALVRIKTGRGEAAMHRVTIAIQEMEEEERLLLGRRRADTEGSGRMMQAIVVLAIVCAVSLAVLATIAIHRDIAARHRAEQEREIVIRQLREALATVKTLTGLLPICAWCKNIRDDRGYWKQLEEYIRDHTQAEFTHGICPKCQENQERALDAPVAADAR